MASAKPASPVMDSVTARRKGGRWVPILAGAMTASLLAFVILPILAIFVQVSPSELLTQLRSPVAVHALAISLKTSAMAMVVIVGLGIPVAYVLSRARWRGAV